MGDAQPAATPETNLVNTSIDHTTHPLSTWVCPYSLHILYVLRTTTYLPSLCPQRVNVWAPSKLVTNLSENMATGRSWTDTGRLESLRGKTVVMSQLVTFA
eukprot:6179842-Pleurochrysis_carterae.AAC.8